MADLLFVTGGARSGKSAFAERLVADLAAETGRPVVYLATLEPLDEEMRARIDHHRARRPETWTTLEAPRDLPAAIRQAPDGACLLVDCLSVWLANRILTLGEDPQPAAVDAFEQEIAAEVDALIQHVAVRGGPVVIVSNEVGGGVVPPYPLGRAYRDVLGRANQRCSAAAARAWLVIAGRALPLPEPFGR